MDPSRVKIDIPCDVQQVDETGHVWAFLHEARDPSRIVPGSIVGLPTKAIPSSRG